MTLAAPVIAAAGEAQANLSALGLASIVIGGLAIFRWGEPRATRDADLTVLCPLGEEAATIRSVLSRLEGRIPDAAEFAMNSRVLLLKASNGTPIDLALGSFPFEHRAVARGSAFRFAPEVTLTTCSAEDLLVMKAFAGRDRDLADIAGVIVRQGDRLQWDPIEQELKPLLELKDDPEMWDRVLAIKGRASR